MHTTNAGQRIKYWSFSFIYLADRPNQLSREGNNSRHSFCHYSSSFTENNKNFLLLSGGFEPEIFW
jgi:hypothetical protein